MRLGGGRTSIAQRISLRCAAGRPGRVGGPRHALGGDHQGDRSRLDHGANNEIGVLQPIGEIAAICRAAGMVQRDWILVTGRLPSLPIGLKASSRRRWPAARKLLEKFVREYRG
jgi:hypothetical protein